LSRFAYITFRNRLSQIVLHGGPVDDDFGRSPKARKFCEKGALILSKSKGRYIKMWQAPQAHGAFES
jgi:hypothetical protein